MTNRLALILGSLILFGLCLDLILGTGRTLYLLRRFTDLIEWVAFWR